MRTAAKTWNLYILPREFVIYNQPPVPTKYTNGYEMHVLGHQGVDTICDFFAGTNETVCVDDDFFFALDLDDFGATIRCTAVIYKACNIPRLGS